MDTDIPIQAAKSLFDKGKLFLKAEIIFVMAFFLWIPTNLIREVIKERAGRQKEAIEEVSSKWAGQKKYIEPIGYRWSLFQVQQIRNDIGSIWQKQKPGGG